MSLLTFENKKIAVIGAARSGIAVSFFLASKGNQVLLSDMKTPEGAPDLEQKLMAAGISWEWNGHTDRVFGSEALVISPGVPGNVPVIVSAQEKGIPVVSEIEVGFTYFPAPVIAITGTNGKTTTTYLTGHLLASAGKNPLIAGNTGTAFTGTSETWPVITHGVLETSSFQLDHISRFHPSVSMILNITPDHLDRYKTFNHYARSKFRITENQTEKDIFIYNADDEIITPYLNEVKAQKWPFSVKKPLHFGAWLEDDQLVLQMNGKKEVILDRKELAIPGIHNVANALAAVLAAKSQGLSNDQIAVGLSSFTGVEHRIEFVRELNGVRYYNDSKATNVDSLKVALTAFDQPIILIAGGREHGNTYKDVGDLLKKQVRLVIAIGETAEKIQRDMHPYVKVLPGSLDFAYAVNLARNEAKPGEVVLLSPACKSFDMFRDYEDRGRQFKHLVNGLQS
ncbi:MAG: UDP-N-acetylmuramoyl-L-alanine--D-glutamate ligase [Bacteroidetes bacterium]|nr:UDP-N-acetylmuramoyl-L-alanine--D-glutamate ligase [Bacteroidota bacterium]